MPLRSPRALPILQRLEDVSDELRGGAVAIGNFDGVHRGHKAVFDAARQAVPEGPVVGITFEPHPRLFFRPDIALPRLSSPREKHQVLAHTPIDAMLELAFDANMAEMQAEDFVARVLVGALAVRTVVVGFDFHFGKGRGGSPTFLAEAGPRHGFTTIIIPPYGGAQPVSSSAIRARLAAGDVEGANLMLGHRWFVLGEVVHGDKIGRTIGYPTANIVLPADTPLAQGVYAVRVAVEGRVYDAVANFGRRPQFHEDGPPFLEAFLFDFSGDLYGKELAVEFLAYLRPELKFAGVDELVAQMGHDSERARTIAAAPADPAIASMIV
ncbi:bifunctional riboflavin kinase/FAD synthetase [Terrihabitans sp. B22-R8]|uniref:bifunctional riboflavin kinase/FAD synthetase n=1 Tax=Terrihabitans sp. B22-R8 TaxID=3425128 RepID=UPI00403CE3AF